MQKIHEIITEILKAQRNEDLESLEFYGNLLRQEAKNLQTENKQNEEGVVTQ